MRKLQEEHRTWVEKKYPNQSPKIPALGCLEEAGELIHALLKTEQVLTWGEDNRYRLADLRMKLVDAIGDCGIYACSLCNANQWSFKQIWEEHTSSLSTELNVQDTAIRIVQVAAELALSPTSYKLLQKYLSYLKAIAHYLGLNLEAIIKTTWLTVKER